MWYGTNNCALFLHPELNILANSKQYGYDYDCFTLKSLMKECGPICSNAITQKAQASSWIAQYKTSLSVQWRIMQNKTKGNSFTVAIYKYPLANTNSGIWKVYINRFNEYPHFAQLLPYKWNYASTAIEARING